MNATRILIFSRLVRKVQPVLTPFCSLRSYRRSLSPTIPQIYRQSTSSNGPAVQRSNSNHPTQHQAQLQNYHPSIPLNPLLWRRWTRLVKKQFRKRNFCMATKVPRSVKGAVKLTIRGYRVRGTWVRDSCLSHTKNMLGNAWVFSEAWIESSPKVKI